MGAANVAIADGTQIKLRDNNLLGERHIRYGGYGGIPYHHISATYIALFSKLFQRMSNWNKVTFYRPEKGATYQHIDTFFTESIDWALIETHWQDMMQVVLSILAGKILPSTLLRKLGSQSRQKKYNRAIRELGRVERTLFLLRYLSEGDFRRSIRAETTKVDSYNDFLDCIGFGVQF